MRRSSALSARSGGLEEIASTPNVRPPAVRTGAEMNEAVRYHSQASSETRSRSPSAPGHSPMRGISTAVPDSTAASVTPPRSGS